MSNKKATKRALLSSIMAIFLCLSMLVGTTFAWFTDSASTAVNKIQAGTLDIALEMKTGTDGEGNPIWANAEGQTLSWKKAAGHETEEVLWEPGCTYELPELRIRNNGNLALKYKIVITGIQGDAELNDAIEWTITNSSDTTALDADHALAAGASDTMTISGHMREDAGNEYQGLSIEGIAITVIASQLASESDSIDNTYDQTALYPEAVIVLPSIVNQPLISNGINYNFADPSGSVKVSLPAAAGSASTSVSIVPAELPDNANVSADVNNEGREAVAYNISMTNATIDNSNLATFDILLGKYLTNVKMYHNDVAMTRVNSMAELDAADEFYYNSSNGYVTFKVSHLSPFTAVYDTPVARIGTTAYYDLQKAFDVGGEVVLLQNISLDEILYINNTVILDLNGKTVSETAPQARRIRVNSTGNLTVRDSAQNGTIQNTDVLASNGEGSYGLIDNYGTLTIESGNFIDKARHGNGGAIRNRAGATLTISGGIFRNEMMETEDTPGSNYFNAGNTCVAAEGNLIVTGGSFSTVCKYSMAIKTFYGSTASIENAVIYSENSGGIEVAGGIATLNNCQIKTNTMNGYYSSAVAVSNGGTVTIKDSGVYSSIGRGVYVFSSGGTVNIEGGNISGAVDSVKLDISQDSHDAVVNIYGGNINGGFSFGGSSTNSKHILNIYGGTFTVDPSDYVSDLCTVTNNGDVWSVDNRVIVNPENVQDYLDGKYGSIDGIVIILSEGNYGKLELGRATKYPGSNTDYYIGGISAENKKTYDDFVAIKTSSQWSASAYYVRNMSNVTIQAAKGAVVTVAGITGTSGHVYGNCYDYVLDKAYTSGSAYYLTQNWNNITFEGITFTAAARIDSSLTTTVIDGVTFKNCTFNIGNTASGNQALRYYNENHDGNVKNLTVENCSFNTCFQGVYTQKINGVTVKNSSFDTTAHNAIAIQSGSGAVNHKAVIITGNRFNHIGDRIIRFGDVGADTQITIKNNTATNSGDSSGQVIKAQSLAEGVTYDISGNDWGDGKTVANPELSDC